MACDEGTIEVDNTRTQNNWQRARPVIGVVALIAIGLLVLSAESDVSAASEADASAIQIIQVWTPNIFYMITIIGVAIAFYIMTRFED